MIYCYLDSRIDIMLSLPPSLFDPIISGKMHPFFPA